MAQGPLYGAPKQAVVIVHAFGSHPGKFWYPRLRDHLASEAALVVVPYMPGGAAPRIADWLACLRSTVHQLARDAPAADVYLVGHSVGCSAILRYLAGQGAGGGDASPLGRLRGVLCVAGWMRVDEPWPEMAPWCESPDMPAARRALEAVGADLTLLVSDNDRYTKDHARNRQEWTSSLGARTVLPVKGADNPVKVDPKAVSALLADELVLANESETHGKEVLLGAVFPGWGAIVAGRSTVRIHAAVEAPREGGPTTVLANWETNYDVKEGSVWYSADVGIGGKQ
eukprot:gene4157-4479_t